MTADKILPLTELKVQVKLWQAQGHTVVFSNGCFDIMHLGHIDYLEKAQNLGSKLVVGLNTDSSVQRLKGKLRPIVAEYPRARMLAALAFVDAVCFFEDDTPKSLIEAICPDILVKGDDYMLQNIVGADFVIACGGSVQTISLVEGFSTSNIIDKIKKN